MKQNLTLYHVFYCVAKEGNISRAAKELYISQPAISKSISNLEAALETKLFVRNSRGVTLTDEGSILYSYVKTAFESIDRGEKELARINDLGIGHIRIGVSTTLCKFILLPILDRFVRQNPHIGITIENADSASTLAKLENGSIDIGLVARPADEKHIAFNPVREIEDIFVCTPSYLKSFHEQNPENKDILLDGHLMMLGRDNVTRRHIDKYLSAQDMHPSNILEVSTMDLLIEFTKIGLGVGCCIKECVQSELDSGSLMQIPLETPIEKRMVGFATLKNAPMTEAMRAFLNNR
ncbi:MAG: LysR family transcriptional regulator [Lachnospiraceae bacterium]|nr:LysR family transcriptional regulator [Lachnospiraceae bacterium]